MIAWTYKPLLKTHTIDHIFNILATLEIDTALVEVYALIVDDSMTARKTPRRHQSTTIAPSQVRDVEQALRRV